jgi:hypothetical protein
MQQDNLTHHGTHDHEHRLDSVVLPSPTPWPMVLSLGVALLITGMVTHWAISVLGVILALRAIYGWFFDVFPHEQHISVPIKAAVLHITSTRTTRAHLPVSTGHRKILPLETFSLFSGIKGGLAGGIAMIVPASLFGLLRFHSIWYPVNLLAAGGFIHWAGESDAFLAQFHLNGLLAAMAIHILTSVLIGLLYGALLPIFPRHPILTAGFLAPALWTGLLYSTLAIISPVLDARIDWLWFVISQVAFGLVCGYVVNLQVRVRTPQFRALPFSVRAGIHSDNPHEKDDEQ